MKRVIVSRVGVFNLQVCCVKDATDEEILEYAERHHPCGTRAGWSKPQRDNEENPNLNPVPCADDSDRIHLILLA